MTDGSSRATPSVGNRIRDSIEAAFERWGHVAYRRAWWVIAASLLVLATLASQLPELEIETSTESMLEEDDPVRLAYNAFREQFGRDEIIALAIRGDVFTGPFLERLRALHEDIESDVPMLTEVTSLVNVRSTRGEGNRLIVEDLLEDWPETPAELEAVQTRAMANPLYRNQILSVDGDFTMVLIQTDAYSSQGATVDALEGFDDEDDISADAAPDGEPAARPFLTGEENSEIVKAVEAVVARHQAPDFEIFLGGNPVMIHYLMRAMLVDMGRFALLAMAAVSVLLAVLFRSLLAVALSITVAVLAVVSALATMAILGLPITAPTQIMPTFLLAVGVGNAVHVLVIFLQARERGDDVERAIAHALGHSGLAIVMTALTTAGGLLSFTTAELAPVAALGIVCPIGTILALVFSLVLLPALIAVAPPKPRKRQIDAEGSPFWSIPIRLGAIGTRHPWKTTLVWSAVLAIASTGAIQVGFSHDPVAWFPKGHPLRAATEMINEKLRGVITLEVLVDSGHENGLHDPGLLKRIDSLQRFAEGTTAGRIFVGKTVSIVDVTKEIHQALNENRPEFHSIPDDPELVAQELLLFENSGTDDLEDVVDSRFQVARVTLKLPLTDAISFDQLFSKLEPGIEQNIGDAATYTITGNWAMLGRTVVALVHSLARTYAFAFLTIAPLMMLLLGSLRLGLLSMVPNLAAIVVTVGLMGWMGWALDAFTLMTGSIALGLAVDDTIHFMHHFRRTFSRLGDAPAAVAETLRTTGQALFFTSLVLSSGFFIYMFASMQNLYFFGLLTGIAIAFAFLANVTLAPALVILLARSRASSVLRATAAPEPEAPTPGFGIESPQP